MQSQTDYSFGIIPLRKGSAGYEVFLINQYSRIGNNTYWVFPKGHPEGEETPLQTAVRELEEETGFTSVRVIEEPTFTLSYRFSFEGRGIQKTVVFYIGIINENQTPTLDPEEVREGAWFLLKDVHERLDYDDTKKLFQEARAYIESSEDLL